MKAKTFVTLSEDVLNAVDKLIGKWNYKSRSDFIEVAVRSYIAQLLRNECNARDLETINRNVDRLNAEASDVLAYQVLY